MYEMKDPEELRNKTVEEIRYVFKKGEYEKIYARIISIEYRNEKFYICGDLFTDSLIEFHDRYCSEEMARWRDIIRPIFLEFRTEIQPERLKEIGGKALKELSSWVESRYPSYQGIKNDEWDSEKIEELCDEYYNVLISIKYDVEGGDTWIGFAASPFKRYRRRICFEDVNINKKVTIATLPNIRVLSSSDISDEIKNFIPGSLVEYNVGQGNFSKLANDTTSIVYDIGFTTFQDHANYNHAICALQCLDAQGFIISHFDIDHILGTIYLKDGQFGKDKLWIVPEPSKMKRLSASAKRLIWFLHNYSNLRCIYDSSTGNVFQLNDYIKIYRGVAKPTIKDSEYKNGSGLMLSVIGSRGKEAILSGDCLYEYWGSMVPNQCDYFVVPHHGCKAQIANRIRGNKESEAIIPVGKGNIYRHPDIKHINELLKCNFYSVILSKHIKEKVYRL